MNKILSKIGILLLIATMSLVVACDKKAELPEESESETEQIILTDKKESETTAEKIEIEIPEPEAYSKFSGLPITNEKNKLSPIAVMIDNHPDARMHAGIRQADMVFEMKVEGTYTRYMLLFHSQEAPLIGPIRSARTYYIDRMSEFDAAYVHVGGSSEATSILSYGNYKDIDGMAATGTAMWRYSETGKVAPHNMYASTESLREYAEQVGYDITSDTEGYQFNKKPEQLNGEIAEKVMVSYFADNNSLFTYMPETSTYSLTKDDIEQVDENDQKPFEITNIIIQEATYYPHAMISGILSLDHFGEGTGYYISQGQYVPITWTKPDEISRTKYFRDGEELKLNPGQTWVLVVDENTVIDFGE